jgi:hypothetical protein
MVLNFGDPFVQVDDRHRQFHVRGGHYGRRDRFGWVRFHGSASLVVSLPLLPVRKALPHDRLHAGK